MHYHQTKLNTCHTAYTTVSSESIGNLSWISTTQKPDWKKASGYLKGGVVNGKAEMGRVQHLLLDDKIYGLGQEDSSDKWIQQYF